jgi:hypothetical protein
MKSFQSPREDPYNFPVPSHLGGGEVPYSRNQTENFNIGGDTFNDALKNQVTRMGRLIHAPDTQFNASDTVMLHATLENEKNDLTSIFLQEYQLNYNQQIEQRSQREIRII